MFRYFMMGGPTMFPLVLLAVVVLAIAMVNAVRLFAMRDGGPKVRSSVNAILFWSGVSAVLGFLGQWNGYYKAAQVLFEEGPKVGVSPSAVILGFGEALISAVVGLTILIVGSVIWYLLHARWSFLSHQGDAA